MLAGLSHLARFLRLQKEQQQEEEAEAEAVEKADAKAEGGEALLSGRVMAMAQMGGGSEDERQQLMTLLLALKQEEEEEEEEEGRLSQQPRRKQQQKEKEEKEKQNQRLCKRQKGPRAVSQEQSRVPQAPQVQQQQEQEEQQRQEQQQQQRQQMEGGEEEKWLSAFSAFPEAGRSAKQVESALASTFAPRYGPDGALRLANGGGGGWGNTGGRRGERSGSGCGSGGGGSSDPGFAVRGNSANPSIAMSNGVCKSNVKVEPHGISESVFSSAGTNSASDAGKKRKSPSPGGPSGRATAAHTLPQHARHRHTPRACYSQSTLGPASASFVQPNPDEPSYTQRIRASILGAAMVVEPHIPVPHVRFNQSGVLEGMCTREHVNVTLKSTQKLPRDERAERYESETYGRACDAHEEWCTDDALDDPNGHMQHEECSTVQDVCGTDDEWLPRCQGIRSGSAPNQKIKRRSMAERRRRERISEKLQRLRAKVRGRGDTCAMLDRAVGYVDALERRVIELERFIITAAGSGRNVFPGDVFAGVGFAGNAFASDAAALSALPSAFTSVPTSLGSDGVANWPWE